MSGSTRIFHLALRSDWEQAQRTGSYTTSTLGRTLAEEGFIHASRGDQWQGVRAAFYADVTEPLVLLAIDTDRLASPVVEESPDGGTETYPHVYGPVDLDAVISVIPLDDQGAVAGQQSFSSLFLREMFGNLLLSCLLLGLVVVGSLLGRELPTEWGVLIGAVIGLAVGIPLVVGLHRRRR